MRAMCFAAWSGVRDIRHVLGRGFLLAAHVGLVSVLVGLSSGWVARSIDDLRAARDLSRSGAMYFVAGQVQPDPTSDQLAALRKHLQDLFADGEAYAILPARGTGAHRARPVTIYGDPGGANATDSGYLDPWLDFRTWDQDRVVHGEQAELASADRQMLAEVAARVVLTAPDAELVASHLQVSQPVITLQPRWFSDKITLDFAPELRGRSAFLAVFVAAMVTTLVSAAVSVGALLRSRAAEFLVHHSVGARGVHVRARLATFIGGIWTVPALVCLAVGVTMTGTRFAVLVYGMLSLGVLVMSSAAVAAAASRVRRHDAVPQLREGSW